MRAADDVGGFSYHLRQVLRDSLVKHSSTNEVTLQGARTTFSITGLPSLSIVVDLDKVSHLGALKSGRWTQICDYLLVMSNNGHVDVTFVEMKETLRETNKPKEQLVRTIPVLKYLLSLCEIEFGPVDNVVQRFAVLASKREERIDKQQTRIEPKYVRHKERHKGVDIRIAVGGTIAFSSLDATV